MAQKFIINDNCIIFGNVDLHKQLCKDHSKTVGGGYWHVDEELKRVYLYSKSLDYGRATLGAVINAMHRGIISHFENYDIYYTHSETLNDALTKSVKLGKLHK